MISSPVQRHLPEVSGLLLSLLALFVVWYVFGRDIHGCVGTRLAPAYKLHGLNFGPYTAGEDPLRGDRIREEELKARMLVFAPFTEWMRTYGSGDEEKIAGRVAHDLNLRSAVGAWLTQDQAANERHISELIQSVRAGDVDIAIVGSETLTRHDLTEDQLIGYIKRVKKEAGGVPVTTSDYYTEILTHPAVVAVCDIVLVNYYPFWEGIRVEEALPVIHGWHGQVKEAAGGKPIIVSETGWPSAGNRIGDAVPSPENASSFFLEFVSWARLNGVPYFYFEAFDEPWKEAHEGPLGAHWGLWDKDGRLKAGIQRVFDGETSPDTWTVNLIPGGQGDPRVEFTYVPPRGGIELVRGRVWHVTAADYKVALFTYTSGGWHAKPFPDRYLTTIQSDGSWICGISFGDVTENPTRIVAYVLPNRFSAPAFRGGPSLPSEADSASVAKADTLR